MIDLNGIFMWLASMNQYVDIALHTMGTLVVLATIYVKLTPSKSDDDWFQKIEGMPIIGALIQQFIRFSYVTRKDNLGKKE